MQVGSASMLMAACFSAGPGLCISFMLLLDQPPPPLYNLHMKVKEIAEQKGFNQSTLSRRADVDFKTVQRLFRDPNRDISVSNTCEARVIPKWEREHIDRIV